MEAAPPRTIGEVRSLVEERRRSTLGLLRTLDRLDLGRYLLDRVPTIQYAELDAELAAFLGEARSVRAHTPLGARLRDELLRVLSAVEDVEAAVLALLPSAQRRVVEEKRPVGELTVDDAELFPPKRGPRGWRGRPL
jgi:hypothetical protein